jgi:hypothetical protein
MDAERFPWRKGYALSDVLRGSWESHQEHLEAVSGPRAEHPVRADRPFSISGLPMRPSGVGGRPAGPASG